MTTPATPTEPTRRDQARTTRTAHPAAPPGDSGPPCAPARAGGIRRSPSSAGRSGNCGVCHRARTADEPANSCVNAQGTVELGPLRPAPRTGRTTGRIETAGSVAEGLDPPRTPRPAAPEPWQAERHRTDAAACSGPPRAVDEWPESRILSCADGVDTDGDDAVDEGAEPGSGHPRNDAGHTADDLAHPDDCVVDMRLGEIRLAKQGSSWPGFRRFSDSCRCVRWWSRSCALRRAIRTAL